MSTPWLRPPGQGRPKGPGLSPDVRRILRIQGLRAFVYGFGSVILGVSLEEGGFSATQVGILLSALVAGTALMSTFIAVAGERIGRRRLYSSLFLLMAASGALFGLAEQFPLLLLATLTGTLSAEVVESGPFTSLEQAMLPGVVQEGRERNRIFGYYNAIAAVVGSMGALVAGGPEFLLRFFGSLPATRRWFLLYVAVGFIAAWMAFRLSLRVEAVGPKRGLPLKRSRGIVIRLASLFALDSFAGGFVIQSFIVYWFRLRFGASIELLGLIFFGVGLLQSASFLVATWLANRIGLLNTMVFTHLPSNLLLASIPLAPALSFAVGLLLARQALSQMDVPTRQSYLMAVVGAEERVAAAAFTNAARYAVRPLAPALAGALTQGLTIGGPFYIAGGLKVIYDLALFMKFRRIRPPEERRPPQTDSTLGG